MKKLVLSFVFVMATVAMFAQYNYNEMGMANVSDQLTFSTLDGGHMERDGKYLTLDGRLLSDAEVLELVGQQNFETYLGAQKQITTGKVFMGVFIGTAAATVALLAPGVVTNNNNLLYMSYIPAVAADVSLPLWIVSSSIGKSRMSWVADDYNSRKSMFFSLSPSIMRGNASPEQANLGLGMTFSVNF